MRRLCRCGDVLKGMYSQLEGIPDTVSEQGMRKGLYQKVGVTGRLCALVLTVPL